ncbi:hypothetical protein [Methanobrevibacter millerae]|uniref:Uncharacterized protein n=1 Tax=Methanobrevibacter millerae TaxID=230361 RepID=A0A0U3CM78_9EURY|nr:hypothetical protein [Methanobrevibacter millerae]ALT69612.1 hypothetical protein sm9_1846 [Methanobrevibacter millerae]
MLEKIEIIQRFNFKKLNKHYDCFIIDLVRGNAYFNINEMIYPDRFFETNYLASYPWSPILNDLKKRVSSKIHHLDEKSIDYIQKKFADLKLFNDFESESFSYFEKLENVYSCNINLYFSGDYQEYCIKNNFPENWIEFGEMLFNLFNFDVLNISNLEKIVTNLFFNIQHDGVYDKKNNRLELTSIEFGHYEVYPYDTPHPSVMVDVENREITGYYEKEDIDLTVLYNLLEKYGVYEWIFESYQNKSKNHDSPVLDGYDWYLELVFNNSIIWNILGHNEYPDTYLCLAYDVKKLTGLDLLEIESIPQEEIELFNNYGKEKLL